METIRGKTSLHLDIDDFNAKVKNYRHAVLDLGTGDGRYVRTLARQCPDLFIVGVDACRENLREHSRARLPNMLFAIACAQELPCEFRERFLHITIHFPWGSLLESLLVCNPGLMEGLMAISRPKARIEISLNGGALAEANTDLQSGAETIHHHLSRHGWRLEPLRPMDRNALIRFPTTWAKRLAYGRDPRAVNLSGTRP